MPTITNASHTAITNRQPVIANPTPIDDTYNQLDAVASTIANYTPSMIPRTRWETVAEFTRSATSDFSPRRPAEARDVLFGIARIADWTTHVAGHPLDRRIVLDPRNIDDFIKRGYPVADSTRRGIIRHYLHVISAELGYGNETRRRARTRPVGDPLAPYTPVEYADFRLTGRTVSTPKRQHNWMSALSLGAGFGITTGELFRVHPTDLRAEQDALILTVRGDAAREIVCLPEWETDVLNVFACRVDEPHLLDIDEMPAKPSTYFAKFLGQAARGNQNRFTVERLRTTWIVRHLNAGTHSEAILRALGATTAAPITRCLPYVEAMSDDDYFAELRIGGTR